MTSNAPSPADADAAGDDSNSVSDSAGLLTIVVHHSITVLILVLLLGIGVWSYLNFQETEFFATVDREARDSALHPPLDRAQKQRIETSLEVYSLLHDRYPNNLDELVSAGLLVPSDLYYPRGRDSWTYERHGDEYALDSLTDDDAP